MLSTKVTNLEYFYSLHSLTFFFSSELSQQNPLFKRNVITFTTMRIFKPLSFWRHQFKDGIGWPILRWSGLKFLFFISQNHNTVQDFWWLLLRGGPWKDNRLQSRAVNSDRPVTSLNGSCFCYSMTQISVVSPLLLGQYIHSRVIEEQILCSSSSVLYMQIACLQLV